MIYLLAGDNVVSKSSCKAEARRRRSKKSQPSARRHGRSQNRICRVAVRHQEKRRRHFLSKEERHQAAGFIVARPMPAAEKEPLEMTQEEKLRNPAKQNCRASHLKFVFIICSAILFLYVQNINI